MANGWVPVGTTITQNPDGTMTLTAPNGWGYAGFDNSGGPVNIDGVAGGASSTVCCTCTGTGSCNPITITVPGPNGGTMSGCVGNCTACSMTQSVVSSGGGTPIWVTNGGFYNNSTPAAWVNRSDVVPAGFQGLASAPGIGTAITNFLNSVYQGQPIPSLIFSGGTVTAPTGNGVAFANIWGRAVLLPIPNSQLTDTIAGGQSASCSCSQGTGCTLKETDIMGTHTATCDAGGCTGSCCLSTSIQSGGGQQTTYQADCYQF